MTDRIHSLTVVLEVDMRDDDVRELENAIRWLKGVLSVDRHVSDVESHMAQGRALAKMRGRILQAMALDQP